MNVRSVVISPSNGNFIPNRSYAKILKQLGFEVWNTLEARTHPAIIHYLRNLLQANPNSFDLIFAGSVKDQYLSIVDVDISRPWTIRTDKGSELISYIDYVQVNPELNYWS